MPDDSKIKITLYNGNLRLAEHSLDDLLHSNSLPDTTDNIELETFAPLDSQLDAYVSYKLSVRSGSIHVRSNNPTWGRGKHAQLREYARKTRAKYFWIRYVIENFSFYF